MVNQNLNQIKDCEVCGNQELQEVLNLGNHPLCDDLVEIGDSRVCQEYPIVIMFCRSCRTAHQKYQVPKAELFPKTYHYRSRFTNDVLNGMKVLVEQIEAEFGSVENKKVLDIGCNDGSLLNFFRERGAATFGIEPTSAFEDSLAKGHVTFNNFFDFASARKIAAEHGKFDVVTFTNVFAHIENLKEVLKALKEVVKESTLIVIENHYLGAVVDKKQFDTFYHEHPRTYSYQSFVEIAKSLEMELLSVEFPSRYGGNIRVTIGNSHNNSITNFNDNEIRAKEAVFFDQLCLMNDFIIDWKTRTKAKLSGLFQEYGKLPAKAFPGRAAILIKLLELDEKVISEVYEKPGSMKIDHYVPGTRIPVVSDNRLIEKIEETPIIINLAWHIKSEIEKYLLDKGFRGSIVDIL